MFSSTPFDPFSLPLACIRGILPGCGTVVGEEGVYGGGGGGWTNDDDDDEDEEEEGKDMVGEKVVDGDSTWGAGRNVLSASLEVCTISCNVTMSHNTTARSRPADASWFEPAE